MMGGEKDPLNHIMLCVPEENRLKGMLLMNDRTPIRRISRFPGVSREKFNLGYHSEMRSDPGLAQVSSL